MKELSRRGFVRLVATSLPLVCSPSIASALTMENRSLKFFHTHTGERLDVEYFVRGEYLPDALGTLNQYLRDFRTGDIHTIDPGLFDLLHGIRGLTGSSRSFEVISGYRSPVTNAMLRQKSEGVAAGSLHMQGQAIDIRLTDIPLPQLRRAALALKRGGVGYYPASNFVHVDTGRVRFW